MKSPGFGDNRRANLEDLAILTGGEVRQVLATFNFFGLNSLIIYT